MKIFNSIWILWLLMMMMMMMIDQISCRVYQYKSLLDSNGLPEECNPSHIRKFNDCQEQMEQRFNIYVDEFYEITEKFCCFVWAQCECELLVAHECNETFAYHLNYKMNNDFGSFCQPILTLDEYRLNKFFTKCFMFDTANSKNFWYWSGLGTIVILITEYSCPEILATIWRWFLTVSGGLASIPYRYFRLGKDAICN
ncbi:hypothetical protein HUG17_2900 [Dermatophagoides farinae]|uniref:Uncharacterized protein n=1 Tax=Dermatophagoides farinae TaxID=6954 RepID=A0A9D4NVG4_DERFA|nr:uncharacterized protein LOC124490677 [Dermatophagoides farinae]KAH7638867.1 hypothetical protein HUG17_2900 [Dermatophagoides farinae]